MVKWWEAVSAKGQLLCFCASGLRVARCRFRGARLDAEKLNEGENCCENGLADFAYSAQ